MIEYEKCDFIWLLVSLWWLSKKKKQMWRFILLILLPPLWKVVWHKNKEIMNGQIMRLSLIQSCPKYFSCHYEQLCRSRQLVGAANLRCVTRLQNFSLCDFPMSVWLACTTFSSGNPSGRSRVLARRQRLYPPVSSSPHTHTRTLLIGGQNEFLHWRLCIRYCSSADRGIDRLMEEEELREVTSWC